MVLSRQLSRQEHGEAAILLAWSATEAVLRQVVEHERIAVVPSQPSQFVKALYMQGVLDTAQYRILQEGQHVRNVIVHGYQGRHTIAETFNQILTITEQLATQYPAR